MPHVTYPGPHDAITFPETGVTVNRGESVEADSEQAAQLVAQGWLAARDKPRSQKIDDVLAWVDSDPVKAQLAIEDENAKAKPRKKLIDQLTELIASNPAPAAPSEED